jgi:S1-C subfamily serine protease
MRRLILPVFLLAVSAPMAEARQSVTASPRARVVYSSRSDDGDRAMLGVSTSSSGKRDTLGLLVESVTPGSPADKAGLEEGNRIASINGVSLKLAREDAGEPDMSSTMTNRLVREMRKLKAGDEAALQVWDGGHVKTVKVKTVAADDLMPERMSRSDMDERPVLGVSLGSSGGKRDTLGVFISEVNENGPADKAGIVEGDRIASINGVDLRVPREDVGDRSVAEGRVARLQREVRKLKPGQPVDLSVVDGGHARSVKVVLGRARDLEGDNGFSFSTGDGGSFMMMPPMAPMVPMAPRGRVHVYSDNGNDVADMDAVRESLRDLGPRIRADVEDQMPRIRAELRDQMPKIRADIRDEMPRIREDIERAMPHMREDLDRDLPDAMDQVRRSMDRLRIEIPRITMRTTHKVVI